MAETLYLVIPCYNEEDVLPETSRRLDIKMREMMERKLINENSKVVFVDDGSKDNTWEIIKQLHNDNNLLAGLKLAHNSGEQNAYLAGMMTAKKFADMVITMDADLQDDINAIDEMVAEFYNGNDIVYGVRASRKNEPFFVRITAEAFYKVMRLMGTELVPNHSQYRLMSCRAIEALSFYEESNLFLPALIPLLGYKSSKVYHERKRRTAGKSTYSFKRLFWLASEAITSFSLMPLRIIISIGVLFLLVFAGITVYSVIQAVTDNFEGWLLVLASVWAVGGTLMLALGVIGEYVGKAYLETKERPRYFVLESLMEPESE